MSKPKIYQEDLYLVQDRDGSVHWYTVDPFRHVDRNELEVDVAQLLFQSFGVGTVANPLRIRLACSLMSRCQQFTAMRMMAMRRGELDCHVEDLNGNSISILDRRRDDPEFPINGIVLDANGEVIQTRSYSLTGECSDGDPDHTLVMVRNARKALTREEELERLQIKPTMK